MYTSSEWLFVGHMTCSHVRVHVEEEDFFILITIHFKAIYAAYAHCAIMYMYMYM